MQGISGVISAVLFVTVIRMGLKSYSKYPGFTILLIVIAFVLGYFTKINAALIILILALIGVGFFSFVDRRYS